MTEATVEQKKLVAKAIFKGRTGILFDFFKSLAILFWANFFCISIAKYLFSQDNPGTLIGFVTVSSLLNGLFSGKYFVKQINKRNDIATKQIKEIFKSE